MEKILNNSCLTELSKREAEIISGGSFGYKLGKWLKEAFCSCDNFTYEPNYDQLRGNKL